MKSVPEPASGLFDGARHLFPLRVYYEDTDLSGLVYHANYLRFCERARSDMLRVLGIDQRAAHEDGAGNYAVAEANMRFFAPARLDDSLVVQTDLAELRAASVRLVQRVVRGEELLVELAIRVGFIAPSGRPRRQPDAWRAAFDQFYRPNSASSQ
ncbi:YbgC/FadM family acyl-CoA thioesterase [Altererythrobacter sp. KTW20L]|uniref:YbgC/FadM family acyl-CoA thioesterase n=1 Tax=Altererythrobacter sp. KTW20L TaxID=2942210 RepID=UPI0020BFB70D|nr:YbgC/FadM family acyl-CoA thioesterase [Altererythrobacter sp. KTW20L]MCL6250535.1 YbgC/FadM family acyl-CoA thioesterase [Altererythrobacter sp. KTW20L]